MNPTTGCSLGLRKPGAIALEGSGLAIKYPPAADAAVAFMKPRRLVLLDIQKSPEYGQVAEGSTSILARKRRVGTLQELVSGELQRPFLAASTLKKMSCSSVGTAFPFIGPSLRRYPAGQ